MAVFITSFITKVIERAIEMFDLELPLTGFIFLLLSQPIFPSFITVPADVSFTLVFLFYTFVLLKYFQGIEEHKKTLVIYLTQVK